VAASLDIARDRALSDARLARLDAQNQPTDAAIEAYARNLYQANSSQFEKPPEARARHILIDNTGADSLEKGKGPTEATPKWCLL
jgi:peptidyl-prolyl cis-trans isomerase C